MAPQLTQGLNSKGTVITINYSGVGNKCTLDTSYVLPATIADEYPAQVVFSAFIHEIIDFAQYELGAADCSRFVSPMVSSAWICCKGCSISTHQY